MNKDEALKMAIEYLDDIKHKIYPAYGFDLIQRQGKVMKACLEALAQPAQEPVAWMSEGGIFTRTKEHAEIWSNNGGKVTPVYTNPAPSWQGLSDDEVQEVFNLGHKTFKEFARAIETALRERNSNDR